MWKELADHEIFRYLQQWQQRFNNVILQALCSKKVCMFCAVRKGVGEGGICMLSGKHSSCIYHHVGVVKVVFVSMFFISFLPKLILSVKFSVILGMQAISVISATRCVRFHDLINEILSHSN